MDSGYSNKPKKLRGAFVEYGLSIPPLFVVFQFNPLQLSRNRSLSFSQPNDVQADCDPAHPKDNRPVTLRDWHQTQKKLDDIRDNQQVTVQEESISLEIRLDATDKMNDGDPIASTLGVLPQISTLELMMHPKGESMLGAALDSLLGLKASGFSFTKKPNPPMMLFIWGYTRVLPVNLNSMSITETEFSTILSPTRATVSVSMTVIESAEPLYTVSKVAKEVASLINLANIADVVNVVVPG
jgi:hypothetical protein